MGLDVVVFRNLKKIGKADNDRECVEGQWYPGNSMRWSERYFPGRGEGIECDAIYEYEDYHSFRGGSYSDYNWWRKRLEVFSKLIKDRKMIESINVEPLLKYESENNPFIELIDFADNQGVIGPIVSKKLYEDFIKYNKEAIEYSKSFEDGDYWLEKYNDWKEGFKFASETGAVEFC